MPLKHSNIETEQHPLLVFPDEHGRIPRESALGILVFYRYLELLSRPYDEALRCQVDRMVRALHRQPCIRTRKSWGRPVPYWSDRHRRAMHSLSNWAEFSGPAEAALMTKRRVREQEATVTSPPVKESNRRKSRVLSYFMLGNTSLDATSRLRVWTPRNETDQPPYVVQTLEDWIDYEVGLGRPPRPCEGSKGNGKVPVLTGTGAQMTVGYDPLPGKFPAAGHYYEGLPDPKLFERKVWARFGLPVDEQTVSPSTTEIQAARDEALASLYAGTPKSRPNFLRALLELKDVRSSARGLADFYVWGRKTLQRWINRPLWAVAGDKCWGVLCHGRESIAQMASLYLNAQFGIIPTAADARLFLDKLREGMKVFAEDQGSPLQYGATVTSHYRVRPRQTHDLGKPKKWEYAKTATVSWYNSDWAKVPQTTKITLSAGDLGTRARDFKVIRATEVSGTVFARVRPEDDLSEYLKKNFGKVGYTWSYPGITTAWELLPWSWLVDWFTDAHLKIRAAERLARSYWMRVAFEPAWYFEKLEYKRYYPNFRFMPPRLIGPSRAYFPGWGSWMNVRFNVRGLVQAFYGSGYGSRASYSRGLLENRPEVPVQRTQCKVNVFRISIGMALIAQAATGSRRFRRWLDERRPPAKRIERMQRQVAREFRREERERLAAVRRARDDVYFASLEDTL